MPKGNNYDDNKTSKKVADVFNTNRTYVNKAKKLKEDDPETFSKVRSGEMTFSDVKKKEKQKALEEKKQEYKESHKKEIKTPPKIHHTDAVSFLNSLGDGSIDVLITDPPYSTDIDNIREFANSWLPLALQKLSEHGRAYICIGAYAEEIEAYFSILNNQDNYVVDSPLIWTYRNTLGQTPKMKYNLNYQMILHIYSKTSDELDTSITNEMFSVQDINAPDGRQGNRLHRWQKPDELARRLVIHSSREGEVIVDPFACTGTFLLQAAKYNRVAIGCDISKDNLQIARERGCTIIGEKI
ncbi:MAG TPA: site-specific DNA-methyltransferase [Bacteroidales bacterium]|nr:site-specific DNA-methyltransferase [Bacteroidales bacterium]